MPTLEERRDESPQVKEMRLKDRTYDFRISIELARYIEAMEVYLLELEQRMQALESGAAENMRPVMESPGPRISMVGGGH